MKHFIYIAQLYVPKNSLEKEISELISKHKNTLLEKTHLKTFINDIRNEIVKLNIKHHRCGGKELIHWSTDNAECYRVEGVGSLYAYKVLIEK